MNWNPESADTATATAWQTAPTQQSGFPYHAQSVANCLAEQKSGFNGLTDAEAASRSLGNKAVASVGKQPPIQAIRQYVSGAWRSAMVLMMLAAAGYCFATLQWREGSLILAATAVQALMYGYMRWKTTSAMQGEAPLHAEHCQVRREGRICHIQSSDVVPGDLLLLSPGLVVPADVRLLQSQDLQVDESMLTGESVLVRKESHAEIPEAADVTEQVTMLFAGTRIKTGKGEALVVAVGGDTFMGRVALLASQTRKRETPLTREFKRIGFQHFMLMGLMTAVVIGVSLYKGETWNEVIPLCLILLAASVPELLPLLASYSLSQGISALAKEQILVKNSQALEAVGDIQVICTDKTGTLTENVMHLEQVYLPGLGLVPYNKDWMMGQGINSLSLEMFLRIARLTNTTVLDGIRSHYTGDPIDIALYRAAPSHLEVGYRRLKDYAFNPKTLRMISVFQDPDGQTVALMKGAPEAIMQVCGSVMRPDGDAIPLTPSLKNELLLMNQDYALEQGMRVIGFARAILPDDSWRSCEEDQPGVVPWQPACFVGWVCLKDPAKDGVKEAISLCQEAGVRMIMVSGDQKATAAVTARELGILHDGDAIWTSADLRDHLGTVPPQVRVFARTKPEEKLAIVEALQRQGERVAMVGDGVNDTPALQKSDVSFAMGIHGAQSAKDSADIILLNDSLAGIITAMGYSRRSLSGLQRSTLMVLATHLGIFLLVASSNILGLGSPLTLNQVLWLTLFSALLSAMTLVDSLEHVNDKVDSDTLEGPAVQPGQFIQRSHWKAIALQGGLSAITALGIFAGLVYLFDVKPDAATGLVFVTMGLLQLMTLTQIHTLQHGGSLMSLMRQWLENRWTFVMLMANVALLSGVLCCGPLQWLMHTQAAPGLYWLAPLVGAVVYGLLVWPSLRTEN